MQVITAKITGTRPLLMRADLFVDSLNPLTKEHKKLTGKRKKTDEDHEAIALSEWRGSLYIDEIGPFLPGENIKACTRDGGKFSKLGTTITRAVEVMNEKCHLEYDGPRDAQGLWEAGFYDARSVKNPGTKGRFPRYRPMFTRWACVAEIAFDPSSINREQVISCLSDGGRYCALGDYRPRFGRFNVEVLS